MTSPTGGIPDVNNIQGMSNGSGHVNKRQLSQQDFLKIFVTQLKNQSPLKPFDSGDMMQQMSQMTSLQASGELQKSIERLSMNVSRSQMVSASDLIGKKVVVPSGVSQLIDGEGMDGSVILPDAVKGVTIEVKNKAGEVIKTIKLDKSEGGVADFHWDGLDEKGNKVDADFYDISAKATIGGKEQKVMTAGNFKVNSVAMDPRSGDVIMNLDGMGGVAMSDIIKIV